MSPEQFRRLALALPDVVEGAHHHHPDFRAHGRVIASLHPDGEQAMVKVPPALQRRLATTQPDVFLPANGAWGRAGCTMLKLATAPVEVVRDALTEAWQLAAGSVASRSASKRAPAAAARRAGKPAAPGDAKVPPRRRR